MVSVMKKGFLIITAIVLTALIVLGVYVQSDQFSEMIRPYIADPIVKALGPDAKIGKVKANLIPLFLEVRDVSVRDHLGREAASIHKLRAYINPLPLLTKKISLPVIAVVEPDVFIERSSDGKNNVAPLVERISANIRELYGTGRSAYRLSLHTVALSRGRVQFNDAASVSKMSATDITANAKINISARNARCTVKHAVVRYSSAAYEGAGLTLKSVINYRQNRIAIESLEISNADARLTASGSIGAFPAANLDLKIRYKAGLAGIGKIKDVLKPAGKKTKGALIEGAVVVKGSLQSPEISGSVMSEGFIIKGTEAHDVSLNFAYSGKEFNLEGGGWRLSRGGEQTIIDGVAASAEYRDGGLDVRRFVIKAEDMVIGLQGRISAAEGSAISLTAESSGESRTLRFLTSLPVSGEIGLKGELSGPVSNPEFSGALTAGPLVYKGSVVDHIEGRLQYRNKRAILSSTDIRQGSSSYVLDGYMDLSDKPAFYSAKLKAVDSDVVGIVAMFYKHIPLDIRATGELFFRGNSQYYSGGAILALGPGKAYGETFDKASLMATLATGRISFPRIVIDKGGGMVRGSGWIDFKGSYSADIESRDVDMSEVASIKGLPLNGKFSLTIRSSGRFSDPYVHAAFSVQDLQLRQIAVGGLTAEAELNERILTLKAGLSEDRLILAGGMNVRPPYDWSADMSVKAEEVDPFLLMAMKETVARSRVTAEGMVKVSGEGTNARKLRGEMSFKRMSLSLGDYRIDNVGLAHLGLSGGRLSIVSLHMAGPGTRITVSGSAIIPEEMDLSLNGSVNLSLLRLLYKEVEYGDGVAEAALAVKEEWKNPEVSGELLIKNGELKIKDVPQKFTALSGKVSFDRERIVADSLTGEIGGGSLRASGRAQLKGLALEDFSMKAALDNVTVRYPAGLVSTLSGDLYYDGSAEEQTLAGEVKIKRARYDKRVDWKSMLADVTRGFTRKRKADIGWIGDTKISIRFHGKDNILLQNNLGKVPVDVDMLFSGTVNQPQVVGKIETRKGVVYFRKNDFRILHASVDFIDPNRINPLLDVQAETRVRDYQVRLAVTGEADHAIVTLMSNPPLADVDILTLLAVGKTSTELTGRESGVGVSEAAALATGQFQDMFERRARSLTGLDRFQVDPYVSKGDMAVPRLTVGKELVQDRLFVTYSSNVGASAPEQIFRIEYILGGNLSLVGERNEIGNIGADLKFRVEFK